MQNLKTTSTLMLPCWAGSLAGVLLLGAGSGCGNSAPVNQPPADLAMARDLGSSSDLAMPADLAPAADLAPPADLLPPTVTVPSGCPSSATAAQVFPIVQASCMLNGCHGTNFSHFQITSIADLKTVFVNVNADQVQVAFPRVAPSNLNRSYLIYKLVGQQANLTMYGGSQMPQGSTLTQAQICTFVAWVASGAN